MISTFKTFEPQKCNVIVISPCCTDRQHYRLTKLMSYLSLSCKHKLVAINLGVILEQYIHLLKHKILTVTFFFLLDICIVFFMVTLSSTQRRADIGACEPRRGRGDIKPFRHRRLAFALTCTTILAFYVCVCQASPVGAGAGRAARDAPLPHIFAE